MRAEPGVALHRHVPDEPPVGDQRHAARRPPHERRPRGARGSATSPRCSATPTSSVDPRTVAARRPAPVHATRACSPASTRCATCPRAIRSGGSTGCAPTGYDVPDRLARRSSTSPADGTEWRTQYDAEHTQTAFLTDRVLDFVDDAAAAAVVRAPLVPAAASAVPRARAVRHDVRPRVGSRRRCARATRAEEGAQHPLLGVMIDHPLLKSPDDRRRSSASSRRRTTG